MCEYVLCGETHRVTMETAKCCVFVRTCVCLGGVVEDLSDVM